MEISQEPDSEQDVSHVSHAGPEEPKNIVSPEVTSEVIDKQGGYGTMYLSWFPNDIHSVLYFSPQVLLKGPGAYACVTCEMYGLRVLRVKCDTLFTTKILTTSDSAT